jgi:hypothetical protein
LIGYSLWRAFNLFSNSWSAAAGMGTVLFVAMLSVAFSHLGAYGEKAGNLFLADISRWIKSGPIGKVFLGGTLAAYVIFIRPAIFSFSTSAYLIEWLIFCFVAWLIFEATKGGLEKQYVVPLKESQWLKHVQKVDDLRDEDFNKIVVLQEDFVEGGTRRDLLLYLKQVLVDNGKNEAEIGESLHLIIEHSDRQVPWYVFGWWKRRILRQNRLTRRKSLDNTIKLLG